MWLLEHHHHYIYMYVFCCSRKLVVVCFHVTSAKGDVVSVFLKFVVVCSHVTSAKGDVSHGPQRRPCVQHIGKAV